jgi:chorismate mutase
MTASPPVLPPDDLASLRASIDNIDVALLHLLAERFKLTHRVGLYKLANGLPSIAPEREQAQFERIRILATQAGLDPAWAQRFLDFIIREVVARHEALRHPPQASGAD